MIESIKHVRLIAEKKNRTAIIQAIGSMLSADTSGLAYSECRVEDEAYFKAQEQLLGRFFDALYMLESNGGSKTVPTPPTDYESAVNEAYKICIQVEEIKSALDEIAKKEERLKNEYSILEAWEELNIPIADIGETEMTVSEFCMSPVSAVTGILSELCISVVNAEDGIANCVVTYKKSDKKYVTDLIYEAGAELVKIPTNRKGTPRDELVEIEDELLECESEKEKLNDELSSLSIDADDIRRGCMAIADEIEIKRAIASTGTSDYAFLLEAWVRANDTKKITERIDDITDAYFIEFRDAESYEEPPLARKNNKFTSCIEKVADKSPVNVNKNIDLAPWYVLIVTLVTALMTPNLWLGLFSAIVSCALLFNKKTKSYSGRLLVCGVLSVIMSMLFGDKLFTAGSEYVFPLLYSPIDSPLKMFALLAGVGMLCKTLTGISEIISSEKSGNELQNVMQSILFGAVALALIIPALALPSAVVALVAAVVIAISNGTIKNGLKKLLGIIISTAVTIIKFGAASAISVMTAQISMYSGFLMSLKGEFAFVTCVLGVIAYLIGFMFVMMIAHAMGEWLIRSELNDNSHIKRFEPMVGYKEESL